MPMNQERALITAAILLAVSLGSRAHPEGSNREYPLVAGTATIEQTPAGPSLAATGHATVNFDDTAAYRDARAEGELNAKAILGQNKNREAPVQSDENGWKLKM